MNAFSEIRNGYALNLRLWFRADSKRNSGHVFG
jgi:hypothetical protein